MRTPAGLVLFLGLPALAAAPAAAGPGKTVPAQIARARYVCLGYDTGDGFLSEQQAISSPADVFPDDRHALDAIRDELETWGRFLITVKPRDAQLLIAVRTARLAGVGAGIGVGTGPGARSGFAGVQVSSPYDTLTVYESSGGRAGAALWRVQRKGALSGSPPLAFRELRADVERTPAPTKKP
jgi:hypothetical protein